MSDFTWKTEMRKTSGAGDLATAEDRAAREVDHLRGQAALKNLGDGRWQLIVAPDAGTFWAEMVMNADDARSLAHAILDADRHELEAPALARVEIIDVAAQALALYGREGAEEIARRPLPEHDYRFHGNPRPGEDSGNASYGDTWTANDIMRAILRDRELKAKGL